MSLKGKTIKIKGDSYTVDSEFIDFENHEEVIILKRPTILKQNEPDEYLDKPSTIYDLGYNFVEDIVYTNEQSKEAKAMLDNRIGHDIMIGMVDQTGIIKLETVKYLGPLLSDPNLIKVEFNDGIRRMSIDFFIKSVLLADELVKALDEYAKKVSKRQSKQDEQSNIYKELLDNGCDNSFEELNEIFTLFNDFFSRRFNG